MVNGRQHDMVVIDHTNRDIVILEELGAQIPKPERETFKFSNHARFPSDCARDDTFPSLLEVAKLTSSQGGVNLPLNPYCQHQIRSSSTDLSILPTDGNSNIAYRHQPSKHNFTRPNTRMVKKQIPLAEPLKSLRPKTDTMS